MIPLLLTLVAGPSRPAPKPRLVVVITVDQLRPDYLDRYRPQLKSGLAMLLKQGAVFTEAYHDHAITETAPGHATILSGRWPAHTGIIRNLAGVQDSATPLIGVTGIGASPARFRSEEHTSELQSLTNLVCRLLLEKKKNLHKLSRKCDVILLGGNNQ